MAFEPKVMGYRLKDLRELSGYSQKDLAEKTGISYSTIRKFEEGTGKNPSIDVLMKLSDFYKISINYLIGMTDDSSFDRVAYSGDLKTIKEEAAKVYLKEYSQKVVEAGDSTVHDIGKLGWPYNLIEGCELASRIDMPMTNAQIEKLDEVIRTTLTDREVSVIFDYYKHGQTLYEIACEKGLTPERIRQVLAKAERKLRHPSRWKVIKYAGVPIDEYNNDILEAKEVRANLIKELNDLRLDNELLEKAYEQLKDLKKTIDIRSIKLEDQPFDYDGLSVRSYNCLSRHFGVWRGTRSSTTEQFKKENKYGLGCFDDITIGHVLNLFKDGSILKVRNLGKKSVLEIANSLVNQGVTDSSVLSYLGGYKCEEATSYKE